MSTDQSASKRYRKKLQGEVDGATLYGAMVGGSSAG
jgi:hypothetical protein